MNFKISPDNKYVKLYLALLIHFSILLQYIDSWGNNQHTAQFFIHPIRKYLPFLLIIFLLMRLTCRFRISNSISKFWKQWYLPIITSFTVLISLIDFFTYDNFIYQYTRHHQDQLGILTAYSWIIWLINQPIVWWKKNFRQFIALLPLMIFFALIIISLWPFDVFLTIIKEDHLIESTQFLVLATGSFTIFHKLFKMPPKNYFHSISLFLIAIICTFVACEEISWGQRVFNLATPQYFLQNNLQQEVTIHNLESHHHLVGLGYLLISWLGLILAISSDKITKWLKPRGYYHRIIPPPMIIGFVLLPALYHFIRCFFFNLLPDWSEPVELFLYIGLVIWMIHGVYYDRIANQATQCP